MKKKLLTLLLCVIISILTVGCGSDKDSSKNGSETEKKEEKLETFKDTDIVVFTDEELREEVMDITGVTERDITYADVKNINELELSHEISDFAFLKYFTALETLSMTLDDSVTNLETLPNQPGIVKLNIAGNGLTNLAGVSMCPELESLGINNSSSLTNVDDLVHCKKLTSISIESCNSLDDITSLAACTNLSVIEIKECELISDKDVEELKVSLGLLEDTQAPADTTSTASTNSVTENNSSEMTDLEENAEYVDIEEEVNAPTENIVSTNIDDSIYIGEYIDQMGDPNLEIARGENGYYIVQIGIYRLTFLDDGVGTLTDNGMAFVSGTPGEGTRLEGIIVVNGGIATVTFTHSEWEHISIGDSYEYEKTSDTPNIDTGI